MIDEDKIIENINVLRSLIKKYKKEYNIKEEIDPAKGIEPKVLVYGLQCALNALYNVLKENDF